MPIKKYKLVKNIILLLFLVFISFNLCLLPNKVFAAEPIATDADGDGFPETAIREIVDEIAAIEEEDEADEEEHNWAIVMCKMMLGESFKDAGELIAGHGDAVNVTVHDKIKNYDVRGGALSELYGILKVLGGFLCISIAIVHLMEKIERGIDPVQAVYLLFIELGISLLAISHVEKIFDVITSVGDLLIAAFAQNLQTSEPPISPEDMIQMVSGGTSGLKLLKFMIIMLLPWVISLMVEIAGKLVSISILLELAIRKLMLPLAVADIYQEGLNSPGVMYIKKYFATYIRGAVAILVCYLTTIIIGSIPLAGSEVTFTYMFSYVFTIAAAQLAGIMAMIVGGNIANDVMGTH